MTTIIELVAFGAACHQILEGLVLKAFPTEDLNRLVSYVIGTLMVWSSFEIMLNQTNFNGSERLLIRLCFAFAVLFLGGGVVMSYLYDVLFGKRRTVVND